MKTNSCNSIIIQIKAFFILCYLFFCPFFGSAQSQADSVLYKKIEILWTEDYPKYVMEKNYAQVIATVSTIDSIAILLQDTMNRADAYWVKSMYFILQGNWKQLESTLNIWETIIDKIPNAEHQNIYLANLNYHYGSYHLYRWNQEAAAYYFGKVIEAYEEGLEIDIITLRSTYINQGLVYKRLGDYKRAVEYYEQSLSFIVKKNTFVRAKVLQNIARAYLHWGQPTKAKTYFQQAANLIDAAPKNNARYHSTRSLIYRNIGEYHYTVTNNLDSAHYYIDASFLKETDTLGLINSWQRKGLTFLKGQQFEIANNAFEKALNLGTSFFAGNHPELAETFFIVGKGFQQQKQHRTALSYYQKALHTLSNDFTASDFTKNPTATQIPIKEFGITLLQEKAKTLTTIGYLRDALHTYQLIDSLMDQKRLKDIITDESFYYFIGSTKNIYEAAIKAALAVNEPKQAFFFAQKAHGLRLLQYVQHDIAKESGNIADSLIRQERQFKININNTQRQLNNPNLSKLEKTSLSQQLFKTEQRYDFFIKKLEQNYPAYFHTKYDLPFTDLSDLQQKVIKENTLLIEYFLTERILYAFVLDQQKITVFELPIGTDFIKNIHQFKTLVSKNSDDQQRFAAYCKVASQLYQTTLQDILGAYKTEGLQHLIIIPDELLNYVSFAALLTEPINPNGRKVNYYHLPYLVKKYTISYNYSSALFYNKKRLKNQVYLNSQVGFAPVFRGQNSNVRNLDSLLHNTKEVNMIDSIIKGKVYLDTAATIPHFKEAITSCKIAHLATHATCNDSLPLSSYIYFYDGSLPIHELYALKNSLELVVLSACETGAGLLKKGEGILSFARAFLQTGCPSVITSLWKVNDRQTPELMEKLYLNLKDGLPKNEALSEAQRQYLNNAETLADTHPYYWANFILIGNRNRIEFDSTWSANRWKWLLGGLVLGIIGLLVLKRV